MVDIFTRNEGTVEMRDRGKEGRRENLSDPLTR
jgi:hypothetical protein